MAIAALAIIEAVSSIPQITLSDVPSAASIEADQRICKNLIVEKVRTLNTKQKINIFRFKDSNNRISKFCLSEI